MLVNFASRNSLKQLIISPTRITNISATTIDLVISNVHYVSCSAPVNYNISDHLPIVLVKKKARDAFYLELIAIIDRHCPYQTVRLYDYHAEYISADLKDLMRKRDTQYKLARRTNNPDAWGLARALRNKVNAELIKAKKLYINSQIDIARGDSKKFWKIINDNFLKTKPQPIDQVFKENSDELLSGKAAVNEVNNFFCNVSTKLSSKFDPIPNAPLSFVDTSDYFERANISIESVKEQIKAIDTGKSSGLSEVNARLLKIALTNVPEFFCDLLNLCIERCTFPSSWKVGTVVIIPKKGDSV